MISDELLVGCLAIGVSVIALAIACGPWNRPYQIRSMAALSSRFGKPTARGIWFLIAIVAGGCGWSILNEIRPAYATPTLREESAR
ncbi:hypothetical protein [Neorhodopirellula pilleata]|uniref:Uncharacterized protein n=1 Tax=Neorhodopirellula pilleata TaxID=2714738 RepID=A0A5C6AU43_9BACT|nr:hypothetical protein [Neorhodopirellula pilleata]TWU03543.1 hypothetical protein Pla100_04700 [Neorhodopirellula pilleata]